MEGGVDLLYEWDRLGEGEPVVPRPVQPPSRPQPARKGFETIDDETVLLGSLSLVRACRHCGVLVSDGQMVCAFCRTIFPRRCSFCGKDAVQGIDAIKGTFFCADCRQEMGERVKG